nr:EAL domain-containing protein [Cryobacterium roopkundense]
MVESAPDAMVVTNSHGEIVLVNAQAERLFGYPREELLGENIEMLIPARLRRHHQRHVDAYAQSPHFRPMASTLSIHAEHKNGSEFPVEVSLSPLSTAGGVLVSSAIRDISDRQRVETASRMLAALVESSSDAGSFEVEVATGERQWSAGFRRIFGFSDDQKPSTDLVLAAVHPEDRQRVEATIDEVNVGGTATDIAFRIVRPSGEIRWVRSRTNVGYVLDGSPWRVLGTMLDVTDMHVAVAKLNLAEANCELGFDRSLIGMAIVDVAGRFLRVNPATCELLGRDQDGILGHSLSDFLDQDPLGPAQRLLVGAEGSQTEVRCVRPGGEILWVEETIFSVPHADPASPTSFVQLRNITGRRQAEQLLEFQSLHDPLTGLANRRLLASTLEDSLARARVSGCPVGVLFFDLDKLKQINDAYGRTVGDRIVLELVRRMHSIVRATDILARFGGGEFVIVCENLTWPNTQRLVDRIVRLDTEPFVIQGRDIFMTVSVGIVVAEGHENVADVLSNSESAMYQAMTSGRGQSSLYAAETHQASSDRFKLELELARALDNGELRVFYQPIIELSTRDVSGFEALIRWHHPTRGLIPPMDFIPIAEESGLIVPIGQWVLREAAAQAMRWLEMEEHGRGLTMAVNLSIVQLRDPGLLGNVLEVLTKTGLDPHSLHLEITESMVIHDFETALDTLHALHALGVQLSVDDFGTGYAALGYLRTMPVQTLKIDKSFIDPLVGHDPRSLSIVEAIVSLARALDLDVIAEGVESVEQMVELQRIGTHLCQGYLFSRPLPAEEIPSWLREFRLRAAP